MLGASQRYSLVDLKAVIWISSGQYCKSKACKVICEGTVSE